LTVPVTPQAPEPRAPIAAPVTASGGDGAVGAVRQVTAPDVEILGVTKEFGDVTAVDNMTLRIARGEFYSLLGPSGCGKTTTLRMIAGFEQPTVGEILLDGRPVAGVPPYRRNVNTVFQHYALFPHMDVARNVGYGLRQKKIARGDEQRRVDEVLRLVRLTGYGRRRTWELSGGQQQRVALARALVNRPTVLLLDEPLGALDRKLRHEMQVELKALQREVGITFVYVTHDQEEALTMSDVIVVMRDGVILQQGGPHDLYQRPVNRFVAGFIGSSNFIDGRVVSRDGSTEEVVIETTSGLRAVGRLGDRAAQPADGTPATLSIRPEKFRLEAPSENGSAPLREGWSRVDGRVSQGTYLGDQTEYRVEADGLGELIVRRQNETAETSIRTFGPGESVVVAWHQEANLVLLD
jgi:spermidine/putrescine transport system ATP-binding protein